MADSGGTGDWPGRGSAAPTTAFARRRARLLASPRYRWWVLWAVLAGLLSVNITFTVFVVALPQVARQLHTTTSTLTWTSTAPLLAFGVAAPVLGKLGDVWGHRTLYLWGLAGAALSVVLTATAPTAGVLILARALDGVQGAATGATSMALVLRVFSSEERVKAMGWWSLVGAGGPVLGITVGAPVIQYLGWRALFWFELPLMAVALVIATLVLPTGGAPGAPTTVSGALSELDWRGSVALAVAVTAGLLALDQAPSWGWSAPPTVALAGLSAVSAVWFVLHERVAPRPLVPLRYFRTRNFTFGVVTQATTNFAYMGGFFLFPILMENVYGYSETRAGLVSTARPLLFSLVAPVAGYAAAVVGERLSAVIGSAVLATSMVLFTRFGAQPSMVLVLTALALSGVGIGIATPSAAASAANEFREDELGVMSAAQLLITQIGVVAGIQVMVTVQASGHDVGGVPTSFHRAYLVGAAAAVVAAISGAFVRNTPRPGRGRFDAGAAMSAGEAGALEAAVAEAGALEVGPGSGPGGGSGGRSGRTDRRT
ncbi:MAG: MFS transporter [Actinomycetota bacterium]|nr:MFS transporter [Actinomycetota bacterium]